MDPPIHIVNGCIQNSSNLLIKFSPNAIIMPNQRYIIEENATNIQYFLAVIDMVNSSEERLSCSLA